MGKHACCYAQGRTGARKWSKVVKVETPEEFIDVVERWFPQ